MGWLWWVLVAVLLGGIAWWLMSRTKPRQDVYDAPGVGDSGTPGSGSSGGAPASSGATAAGAGAVGAAGVAGVAVLGRDEPAAVDTAPAPDAVPAAGEDPAVATAPAPDATPAEAAPSADLDPAAAGIAAPAETDAETAPEAVGAAPDEAGWAPAGAPADPLPPAPTGADQAAAEADVEVPSDAPAGGAPVASEASGAVAADVAPVEETDTSGQTLTGDNAEDPGHQMPETFRADEVSPVPGQSGTAGSTSATAWAQDQSDVASGDEAPVVSEASGAAAADVAPAATAGTEVESGSTDIEFADASVATYEEPPADPSYTPTHLASEPTTQTATSQAPGAPDTSIDPAAAPQETPAPETGAGEGFGGAAIGGTAEASDGPYGPGSAEPLPDGSAPGAAYRVKGNVDSMRFHGPESPYYNRTTAEVWFTDADTARAAGFTSWNE